MAEKLPGRRITGREPDAGVVIGRKQATVKPLHEEPPIVPLRNAFNQEYADLTRHSVFKRIVRPLKKRGGITIFEGGIGIFDPHLGPAVFQVASRLGFGNLKKVYLHEPKSALAAQLGRSLGYLSSKKAASIVRERARREDGPGTSYPVHIPKEHLGKIKVAVANVFNSAPIEQCDLVFSHMVMPHLDKGNQHVFFDHLVERTKPGGYLFVDIVPPLRRPGEDGQLNDASAAAFIAGKLTKREEGWFIHNKGPFLNERAKEEANRVLRKSGLRLVDIDDASLFFILQKKK